MKRRFVTLTRDREATFLATAKAALSSIMSMHEEAVSNGERLLTAVYHEGDKGQLYVGVGDRRGLYLVCNYGSAPWLCDLTSVSPDGLKGRRKVIEYDFGGDPHAAPVQCIVPFDVGSKIILEFLSKNALPLDIEWVSDTGLRRLFGKP
jgi:hypothetical protein